MRHQRLAGPSFATRALVAAVSVTLSLPLETFPAMAQSPAPAGASPTAAAQGQPGTPDQVNAFSTEQLDALLAPIALYPDPLLTPILMAATEPLQIVQAKRWLDDPTHAALKGDALTAALASETWDPSVKALVPFPTVIDMLNSNLDWTQQLGYAFATQQADVLDSVQRLRRQAQAAGTLTSTPQQTVTQQADAVVIQPADPNVVFVPAYNPTVVYGAWPYPASPPVYFPPPPGYALGSALATGLAFGTGIAITAGLWNLATPNWGWRGPGYGGVNVNVNRWNNVNVNRPPLQNGSWRPPPAGRPGGWNPGRPPAGPVGRPIRESGLPANAVGRPTVPVRSDLVNRPARPPGSPPALQRPGGGGGPVGGSKLPQRPGGGGGNPPQRPAGGGGNLPQRPTGGGGANLPQRPTGGGGANLPQRPAGGGGASMPQRPAAAPRPQPRPSGGGSGAFAGMSDGRQAGQFAARGGQSRQSIQAGRPAGGGNHGGGGGGAPRGGGGGARGGGGGGRHR